MQPSDSNNNNVWISKEEYERLRTLENSPYIGSTQITAEDEKVLKSQRTWQVILGALISLVLYFSVVTGAAANIFLVLAIVIFGGVSLIDFIRSRSNQISGVPKKAFKHNPYKILAIAMLCLTVLPALALFGFFFLFLTLGGGDMGS